MAFGTAKNYKGYTPKLTCETLSSHVKDLVDLGNCS